MLGKSVLPKKSSSKVFHNVMTGQSNIYTIPEFLGHKYSLIYNVPGEGRIVGHKFRH